MSSLRKAGAFVVKHSAGRERVGLHDVCCCYRGVYVALEAKASYSAWRLWIRDKSKQSPTQKKVLQEVRQSGGVGFCTWRYEDVNLALGMIDADRPNDEINAAIDAAQEAYVEAHSRPSGRSRIRTQQRQCPKTVPANMARTSRKVDAA